MTTTEDVHQPSVLSEFMNFLPRQVMIRYLLSYTKFSCHFMATLLSAPGLPGQTPEHCLSMNLSVGDNFTSPGLNSFEFLPGAEAHAHVESKLALFSEVSGHSRWWGHFLEPRPFVGVMIVDGHPGNPLNMVASELPADSPHFMIFHGVVAARLGAQSRALKSLPSMGSRHHDQCEAMKILENRYNAFVGTIANEQITKLLGSIL